MLKAGRSSRKEAAVMANQPDGQQTTPNDEAFTDERLPLTDLEQEGQHPPARGRRLAQLGIAVLAAIITLVTFRGLITPARPAALEPTPRSTPSTTMLLLTSNVNYGALTINGQTRQATLPLLMKVLNQSYDISLAPAPLRPISCHLTFAHGGVDTFSTNAPGRCWAGQSSYQVSDSTTNSHAFIFEVNLSFAAGNLPGGQIQQINGLVSQHVTAQQDVTIPVGSYFATGITADGTITSQQSGGLLQATATLLPSATDAQFGFDCGEPICPGDLDWHTLSQLVGQVWVVSVPVALHWRVNTAAGKTISDVSFPTAETIDFFLTYDAAQGWRIVEQSGVATASLADELANLNCSTALLLLQPQLTRDNPTLTESFNRGIEGCEIIVRQNGENGAYLGKLIWRFGVLLAGDDQAHALLPALPLAPPDEVAAVEH
jgi:hypothetical protein